MFEESKRTSAIALDYLKLGIDLGSSTQVENYQSSGAANKDPGVSQANPQLQIYPDGKGDNLPY